MALSVAARLTYSLYLAFKFLLDIVFASIIIALCIPTFVLVSLAILITSGRPIFFRQTRVGVNGQQFQILKFRTMINGAERVGPQVTSADDSRITPVGKFLRSTKLDELPQFFNVLRGEMSLVGPRPQVPKYVAKFPEPAKGIILSVRPGITSPTSLRYRNEEEILKGIADRENYYESIILPAKAALDADYVLNQNFRTDTKAVIDTAGLLCKSLLAKARRFAKRTIKSSAQSVVVETESARVFDIAS